MNSEGASTASGSFGQTIILESIITCPSCGHAEVEFMPTNACQYFYRCICCKTLLKPKPGDCCVFSSYGSVTCPSMQKGKSCLEGNGDGKLVIRSI